MNISRKSLGASALAIALLAGANSAAAEEPTVFGNVVHPILMNKCAGCHGEKKKKGKFALHTVELMLKGGSSGEKSIVPSKSGDSELWKRVALPEDDEDHMPPEGKPQLTETEAKLLQWWIDAGATTELTIAAAKIPGDLKSAVEEMSKKNASAAASAAKKAADKVVVPKLTADQETKSKALQEELGIVILPLSQEDPGLSFTAVNVAKEFGDDHLAKFGPLAPNFVDMNLARTKVTDGGLAHLSKMPNLQRLRLERTEVTDAGLGQLKELEHLQYLNLYGTKVSDAGLDHLAGLKKLKRLYLWQTGVTKEGAEKLYKALPEVTINLGWDKEVGKNAVAAAKPIVDPEKEKKEKKEKAAADLKKKADDAVKAAEEATKKAEEAKKAAEEAKKAAEEAQKAIK